MHFSSYATSTGENYSSSTLVAVTGLRVLHALPRKAYTAAVNVTVVVCTARRA
jgi:hypothetical protein